MEISDLCFFVYGERAHLPAEFMGLLPYTYPAHGHSSQQDEFPKGGAWARHLEDRSTHFLKGGLSKMHESRPYRAEEARRPPKIKTRRIVILTNRASFPKAGRGPRLLEDPSTHFLKGGLSKLHESRPYRAESCFSKIRTPGLSPRPLESRPYRAQSCLSKIRTPGLSPRPFESCPFRADLG